MSIKSRAKPIAFSASFCNSFPIFGPTDSTLLKVNVFPNAVVSFSEISELDPENCVLIKTSLGFPN